MQPTFRFDVPGRLDDVLSKLRKAIAAPGLRTHVESSGACFDFKIEPSQRRLWSPHLGVQLSQKETTTDTPLTEVYGRFSPRPEIWTGVMMVYFGAACVIFFAIMFGYAQWALGTQPWALWFVPAGVTLIAGLHIASLIGQRLSADQMRLLRSRFDQACEIAFD